MTVRAAKRGVSIREASVRGDIFQEGKAGLRENLGRRRLKTLRLKFLSLNRD